MSYKIVFSQQAMKDMEKVLKSKYKSKVLHLLEVLEEDPFQPPFEKLLVWDNTYFRRINVQHRLVYEVNKSEQTVKIMRMWTHYE